MSTRADICIDSNSRNSSITLCSCNFSYARGRGRSLKDTKRCQYWAIWYFSPLMHYCWKIYHISMTLGIWGSIAIKIGNMVATFLQKAFIWHVLSVLSPSLPRRQMRPQIVFLSDLKNHCRLFKVPKVWRFTKWSDCEYLHTSLPRDGTNETETTELISLSDDHVQNNEVSSILNQNQKRWNHRSACIWTSTFPINFTLPCQPFHGKKDQQSHRLEVYLIIMLMNAPISQITLFKMDEHHCKRLEHVVEVIKRVISDLYKGGRLPRAVFLQFDNGTRTQWPKIYDKNDRNL